MDEGLGWGGGGGANVGGFESDFGILKGYVDGLDGGVCVCDDGEGF